MTAQQVEWAEARRLSILEGASVSDVEVFYKAERGDTREGFFMGAEGQRCSVQDAETGDYAEVVRGRVRMTDHHLALYVSAAN